jgi:hypothetical protein
MHRYVTDNLGATARGALASDLASPISVTVAPVVVSSDTVVAFLLGKKDELVGDALGQGRTAAVTSNVQLMAQVLSRATDPCADVHCGTFGTCVAGVCMCDPGSGFSGPACEVSPSAVLSEWSQFGSCSVSCGGGTRTRSRTCTPPR